MTALATTNPPASEPSSPDWLTPLVSTLEEIDGIPHLPRGTALSSTRRRELETMVSNFDRYLLPAVRQEVAPVIARLFMAFPGERLSRDEAGMRADGYMIALEGLPLWAVEQAAKWWLRGERGDGRENYAFAPSPPQFRQLAEKATLSARARRYEAIKVLQAREQREPDPAMQARVGEMLTGLAGKLRTARADGEAA